MITSSAMVLSFDFASAAFTSTVPRNAFALGVVGGGVTCVFFPGTASAFGPAPGTIAGWKATAPAGGTASAAYTHDGWRIYEGRGPDEAATYTVWLPSDGELPDEFSVEGRLRIIEHPPCKLHDGFTEYRIIARR